MDLLVSIRHLLAGLSLDMPVKIRRIGEGLSTHVFLIITKKGEKYYLRIPINPLESVIPEVMIHNELYKVGVHCPRIVAYCDSSVALGGGSFLLIEPISGSSCSGRLHSNQLKAILYAAGKDLYLINSISAEGFGSVYKMKDQIINVLKGNQNKYKDFICSRIETNLHILKESQYFTNVQMKIMEKVLSSSLFLDHVSKVKEAYLAHGDYHLGHIFQNNYLYSGIIDFGDSKIAPKGYDLAYFKIRNPNYYKYLYNGYIEAAGGSSIFLEDPILIFLIGIRVLASAFDNHKITGITDPRYRSFVSELNSFTNLL